MPFYILYESRLLNIPFIFIIFAPLTKANGIILATVLLQGHLNGVLASNMLVAAATFD